MMKRDDFNFPIPDKVFFTSDTHFGHTNILKYCKRPFGSIEEHDEELIRRWNEKVPSDGIVFHLGDIGFGSRKHINDVLSRLNGTINLCIGNHDWRLLNDLDHNLVKYKFNRITQQMNLKIDGRHVILNHFPLLAFSGAWRGIDATYQLFGHVHTSPYTDEGLDQQRMKYLFTTQYDVGVDNNDFTPVSWAEVNNIIQNSMLSLGMCRNEKDYKFDAEGL